MFLFNLVFLVMMTLLSIMQAGLLFLILASTKKTEINGIPWSNMLMTLGTTLLAVCAYLGLHEPIFSSRTIGLYAPGLLLIVAGGLKAFQQIKSRQPNVKLL